MGRERHGYRRGPDHWRGRADAAAAGVRGRCWGNNSAWRACRPFRQMSIAVRRCLMRDRCNLLTHPKYLVLGLGTPGWMWRGIATAVVNHFQDLQSRGTQTGSESRPDAFGASTGFERGQPPGRRGGWSGGRHGGQGWMRRSGLAA
jgi:hypothetical protein